MSGSQHKTLAWNKQQILNNLSTLNKKLIRLDLINSNFGPEKLKFGTENAGDILAAFSNYGKERLHVLSEYVFVSEEQGCEEQTCMCDSSNGENRVHIKRTCPCNQILICNEVSATTCKVDINDMTICETVTSCVPVCF